MNNMEMSIIEAGGLTGKVYDTKTHSITKQEHKWFIEWQEANRRKEEKEKEKTSK